MVGYSLLRDGVIIGVYAVLKEEELDSTHSS